MMGSTYSLAWKVLQEELPVKAQYKIASNITAFFI